MITLDNVAKTFSNQQAVDNISLKVNMEETMVLLVISSCGKTITL